VAAAIPGITIIARSMNMTASNNDNGDSIIPSLAGRAIDHDILSNLERIAFETEGEPGILFEPVNLLAYTTAELWVLSSMLGARGLYQHAHHCRPTCSGEARRRRAAPARASS
jgi:hypothetical protein